MIYNQKQHLRPAGNEKTMNTPFHLAIAVSDLKKAKEFYGKLLGAKEMRSSDLWVDFNFFGHQLTCHLTKSQKNGLVHSNLVDNTKVPIPHFGVILPLQEFEHIEQRLRKKNITFFIEPQIRFKNQISEQKTMFLKDPFKHFIEIKSFIRTKEY